ncbi:MAG TPA: hypothetical protein VFM69_15795 [Pricia sp.]|nr:hypothetical protein [Pricia sp.]
MNYKTVLIWKVLDRDIGRPNFISVVNHTVFREQLFYECSETPKKQFYGDGIVHVGFWRVRWKHN